MTRSPIINVQDKQALKRFAYDLCCEFMAANGTPKCTFDFVDKLPKLPMCDKRTDYGVYYSSPLCKARIAVHQCRAPIQSRHSWSWPGWKADLTVLGVTAHEVGHHMTYSLGRARQLELRKAIKALKERPVTSYGATSPEEDLAESLKVFITNPTLLELMWPQRYELLSTLWEPVETRPWHEVLSGASLQLDVVDRFLLTSKDVSPWEEEL